MSVLTPVKSIRIRIIRWSAAAVLLGLLGFLSYFYFLNEDFALPTAHKSKPVSELFRSRPDTKRERNQGSVNNGNGRRKYNSS